MCILYIQFNSTMARKEKAWMELHLEKVDYRGATAPKTLGF